MLIDCLCYWKRLLVNGRRLVVKLLGSQQLYSGALTMWRVSAPKTPHHLKVSRISSPQSAQPASTWSLIVGQIRFLPVPLALAWVVSACLIPVYSPRVSMATFLPLALGTLCKLFAQIPKVLRGLHLSTRCFTPHSLQLWFNCGSCGCLVTQPDFSTTRSKDLNLCFFCESPATLCLEGELLVGPKHIN